jgi:hypothetical protein
MSAAFFIAEDAQPLPPLGTCVNCGKYEDPMVAIFWSVDDAGCAHCPECSGEHPTEGYRHFVLVARIDRQGLPYMHGPYSAGESERVRAYFMRLDNVKSAEVIAPEKA